MRAVLAVSAAAVLAVRAAPLASQEASPAPQRGLAIPFARQVVSWTSASSPSRRVKRQSINGSGTDANDTDDTASLGNQQQVRYVANITIAGQALGVILDTGSTDTFVYSVNPSQALQLGLPLSALPPLFNNATAVGLQNTPLTYNTSYGSKGAMSTALGAVQKAPIHIQGTNLTVQNQSFANIYDGSTLTGASGLLGLGLLLTSDIYFDALDYYANTLNQPLTTQQTTAWFPIVASLKAQGQIARNMFSLVVDRINLGLNALSNSQAFNTTFGNGTIIIGDYPDAYPESSFTFSPVPTVQINQRGMAQGLPSAVANRWTLEVQAIYFNGVRVQQTLLQPSLQDDGGKLYALIDSGNPSMNFPRDVLSQISSAYAANRAGATIPCNTNFDLKFLIGGKNFTMSKADMVVPSLLAIDSAGLGGQATRDCQVQAQPTTPIEDEYSNGTSITYQFGDPFLRNVAAVFDGGDFLNPVASPPRIGLAQR